MTEMTDSGYPTPAPVNFPILEVGWEGDSDSDSEDSDDGVVNGTCGRGCTGLYGLQGCCEPCHPPLNSVAQFNVSSRDTSTPSQVFLRRLRNSRTEQY